MAMLSNKLIIGISSRALFNLDKSNDIFEKQGLAEYIRCQIEIEDGILEPGVAFELIKRLLELKDPKTEQNLVEVILASQNDANTGLRILNSIESHRLNITRACFTKGRSPHGYLNTFGAHLFLSASSEDVRKALERGYAAATILTGLNFGNDDTNEIRIAFDGDAVLFSDESEKIFQEKGLAAFQENEQNKSNIPLEPGPFKSFLEALHQIQRAYAGSSEQPIRTALVTARSAPAHKRVIRTLRHWGINIDEAFFLGGLDKTPILEGFKPHIFFDDQEVHCQQAASQIPTGHVPSGIKNLRP
jgi:5'-nucleotidase